MTLGDYKTIFFLIIPKQNVGCPVLFKDTTVCFQVYSQHILGQSNLWQKSGIATSSLEHSQPRDEYLPFSISAIP